MLVTEYLVRLLTGLKAFIIIIQLWLMEMEGLVSLTSSIVMQESCPLMLVVAMMEMILVPVMVKLGAQE
tara:strand:+ start:112 stop:318 length:207 start_codon:yes stop_codon:yes gene_type:complete